MQNDGSESYAENTQICGEHCRNLPSKEHDLEKQDNTSGLLPHGGIDQALSENITTEASSAVLSIVVSDSECHVIHVIPSKEEPILDSPTKGYLSRTTSSQEQCRVCQQGKEEVLINLGCKCKGGLSKAHHSCIDTWFCTRGSNKCEICQEIAVNVSPPESHPSTSYRVWRADPTFQPQNPERGCFSPLWVAFAILIGGLLLDVLISITLGVSALPVNIIIGVIVVLGLGTALRLVLEFCHKWSFRRGVREESNVNLGYNPSL